MDIIPLVLYTVAIFAGLAALFMVGSFIVFKIKEPKEEKTEQKIKEKPEEQKEKAADQKAKQNDANQKPRVKSASSSGVNHSVKPRPVKSDQGKMRTVRVTALKEQKKNLDARTTKPNKIHRHLVPSQKERFRVLNNKQQSSIRNDPRRRTTRPFYHPNTGITGKGEDEVKSAMQAYSNKKEELKRIDLKKKNQDNK